MMSPPTGVFNDFFIYFQDLSEYVGVSNIGQGFYGVPVLNKCDDPLTWLSTAFCDHAKPDIILMTKKFKIKCSL